MEEGLDGHGWALPKPDAPGPSHDAGVTPKMPASEGEILESEPHDQGGSQLNQPFPKPDLEKVAEVVILDDDDIDLTFEVPQAASTPISEPAQCRKRSPEDQDPHSSPSKKQAAKEEGMSMPKGVRIKTSCPKDMKPSLLTTSGFIG